ncbi:MAG: lipoyl synthase [Bacteroidota bacterium]|nr:lipoyl synthase [Bacteroidota bacterium]MDP4205757.1 lipoyl synthase [Bacteroidota bacterium]
MKIMRKPEWLKIKLPEGENFRKVDTIVKTHGLHTICSSGRCPNMGECWGNGTATFMILGDICTRSCKFCNVKTGKPAPVNPEEPANLANSIHLMQLKHAVITSVDRDDLPDKGASFWAETVLKIRELNPDTTLETLIPDFDAIPELLDKLIAVKPEIISHNLETVRRLTPQVRSRAKYNTSLKVIRYLADNGINTKSGIMLGLGESEEEIFETMDDLLEAGCNILTIGQYLQPSHDHLDVNRYVTPEEFEHLKQVGLEKGFKFVESGPLVRSSYHAEKQI